VNERPALAGIGTGGEGESDIDNSATAGFQVVGLVDVIDAKRIPELHRNARMQSLLKQRDTYPDAKFYSGLARDAL